MQDLKSMREAVVASVECGCHEINGAAVDTIVNYFIENQDYLPREVAAAVIDALYYFYLYDHGITPAVIPPPVA